MTRMSNSDLCVGFEPTHTDIAYSQQDALCKLDVWLPKGTKEPCPIMVYYHGGGFTGGDKSAFRHNRVPKYLAKGIAFASVNYPLLDDADALDRVTTTNPVQLAAAYLAKAPAYLNIKARAAESIRFLKAQAGEWTIDPARIAVMGTSAGAMIAEYLTYWQDLGITACFAEEQPYRSQYLLWSVKKGHPPLILYTLSGATDKVHNPQFARTFKEHFDKVGVSCDLYGSEASGLPQLPVGQDIDDRMVDVLFEQWDRRDA